MTNDDWSAKWTRYLQLQHTANTVPIDLQDWIQHLHIIRGCLTRQSSDLRHHPISACSTAVTAVEHMQFTINVQILKFLNTNFSWYSSISESHSGNTKTVREEQMEKWDNCSRQPSRLQSLAAHAYKFLFVWGARKQANSVLFTF